MLHTTKLKCDVFSIDVMSQRKVILHAARYLAQLVSWSKLFLQFFFYTGKSGKCITVLFEMHECLFEMKSPGLAFSSSPVIKCIAVFISYISSGSMQNWKHEYRCKVYNFSLITYSLFFLFWMLEGLFNIYKFHGMNSNFCATLSM